MKKFLILPLFFSFFLAGTVFAHVEDEATTTVDLGIENPGTLPTSPFYFLKEWRRGLKLLFTFDRVKKAELELEISNEKAAEAKKVEEENPDNIEAIKRAIENYKKSQERLRSRLEALRDISENPQIERLLERLEERTEKHERLFERLLEKFEDHEELRDTLRQAKERASEILERARERSDKLEEEVQDDDEAYREKLEDLEECGPQPGAPGNWVCEEGRWQSLDEGRDIIVCTQEY
ncbi:MAG: DUF5667 domain-containing protein, partial [Patescibacteria group bacterium]